jgi:transposase
VVLRHQSLLLGDIRIRHMSMLPIRQKRARLYFRLRRGRCQRCRKTAQQPVTGLDPLHASTARLTHYIEQESLNIFRTFNNIANETGKNSRTVRDIGVAHAIKLQQHRIIDTPQWLAIDEAHLKRGLVCCVVSAPERRQVLDLFPDSRITLRKWLLQLPMNFAAASCGVSEEVELFLV